MAAWICNPRKWSPEFEPTWETQQQDSDWKERKPKIMIRDIFLLKSEKGTFRSFKLTTWNVIHKWWYICMCKYNTLYMFCANIFYIFLKSVYIFYVIMHVRLLYVICVCTYNICCICTCFNYMLCMFAHILYAIYLYCILCVWIINHMLYMCIHMCVHIHMYSFFSTFNFLLHYRNRLIMDFNIVFVKNVLGEWVLEEIQLWSQWRIGCCMNTLHCGLKQEK